MKGMDIMSAAVEETVTTATDASGAVVAIAESESITVTTFDVGDAVVISEEARESDGTPVPSAAYGQVGTVEDASYLDRYGYAVRYDDPEWGTRSNFVDPKFLRHLTPEEQATRELETAQTQARTAEESLSRTIREHEEWKTRLVEIAYEAAEENDLCRVFDETMEKIGLPGREREFTMSVEFSGTVYVTVTAHSKDEAREQIDRAAIIEAIADAPEWRQPQTIDKWEADSDY
jgi:ribosomal protein L21E